MSAIRDELGPAELEVWARIWRKLLVPCDTHSCDEQHDEPEPREETDDDN